MRLSAASLLVVCAAAITAIPSLAARAASVVLRPIAAGNANDQDRNGVWDEMRSPLEQFLAFNSRNGYSWRGVVEFDLSSIPANSTILVATLFLGYDGSAGDIDSPSMQMNGYRGDGLITFSDFAVDSPIAPLVPPRQPNGWRTDATAFVKNIVDGAPPIAGFMFENEGPNQTAIHGTQAANVLQRPILSIIFNPPPPTPPVPLPASVWTGLVLLAFAAILRFRHPPITVG